MGVSLLRTAQSLLTGRTFFYTSVKRVGCSLLGSGYAFPSLIQLASGIPFTFPYLVQDHGLVYPVEIHQYYVSTILYFI